MARWRCSDQPHIITVMAPAVGGTNGRNGRLTVPGTGGWNTTYGRSAVVLLRTPRSLGRTLGEAAAGVPAPAAATPTRPSSTSVEPPSSGAISDTRVLYISRGLARAQGGELSVQPATDVGSDLVLQLPIDAG